MSTGVHNEVIRASAGSGKTHQLVNRFLRLLALGVEPGRIIALTFTRKAAGEFLQKIFIRLTEAAGGEGPARRLAAEIGAGEPSADFFRGLLSALVRELGSLQLGTIDSFFARIVGAFPYELGLARPHRIMDDFERNAARQLAMERLLALGDPEHENRLLQLYKQLTWGAEEKNVYGLFEAKLADYHDLYLEQRDPALWGAGGRVFTGPPWWMAKEEDPVALADAIARELEPLAPGKAMAGAFEKLLALFAAWQPGQPFTAGTLWDNLLAQREQLRQGTATLSYNRNVLEVTPPLSGLLYRMVQAWVRGEIARRLVMTASLGQILSEYDRHYETSVREAGSLVFADLPMILIKGLCEGGAAISADDLVYRLDGQLDHWMIDEFQDTSRIQWKVLSAFVDEVLQDASGRRSFFYVGDVKQSIYGWRGGDARLFDEVFDHYNRGGPCIAEASLYTSYRSAPPVLACVNALFGPGPAIAMLPQAVRDRWSRQWAAHAASDRTAGLAGYAAWGLVEDGAQLEDACAGLVRRVDPLGRGLTCAVLMRKNDQVASMTQALRAAGIPASMEGVVHIGLDNVVGLWIRAFLYALARPDETFPRAFLGMPGIDMDGPGYQRLAGLVRSLVTTDGFTEAVRRLLQHLQGIIDGSEFLRRRAEQLLEAATRFTSSGLDALEPFIAYLGSATIKESTLHTQVQVMTVHKAKGLDFDMVVVAGFGGDPLVRPQTSSLHVQRGPDGDIDWILDLPNKLVLEQDPELSAAQSRKSEESVLEALCLLYVAMTRARQGLYCLAAEPARNSSQTTWHGLFEAAFGGSHETRVEDGVRWLREWGTAGWFADLQREEHPGPAPIRLDTLGGPVPVVRRPLRRMASPSREAHAGQAAVHRLRSNAGRLFGTRMHDFLATIEWLEFDQPAVVDAAIERADPDLRERVARLLASPRGREVFSMPARACRLWREKPYALRREDRLANGIIDRAILFLDAAGLPVRVVIHDFKTDTLDPARDPGEQLLEKYALQLERYREAAAILTGLAPDAISTQLVPV